MDKGNAENINVYSNSTKKPKKEVSHNQSAKKSTNKERVEAFKRYPYFDALGLTQVKPFTGGFREEFTGYWHIDSLRINKLTGLEVVPVDEDYYEANQELVGQDGKRIKIINVYGNTMSVVSLEGSNLNTRYVVLRTKGLEIVTRLDKDGKFNGGDYHS